MAGGNVTYQFEEYTPRHKAQIAALRDRIWGGGEAFNKKYFEWKYEQNPYLSAPHFYVALYRDQVIGMRGCMGSRWQAGGEADSLVIPMGGDLAVDLEHRRKKLAARILTFVTEHMSAKGYPYLMNMSSNSSSRRLQIRSGYPRVLTYVTFQRGVPSESFAARVMRRLQRKLVRQRNILPFQTFDKWAAETSGSIIGDSKPRIREMTGLASRQENDESRIHLVRDAAYYGWRFGNPASAYRFIYCYRNECLEGYLILQAPRRGGGTTIIDWAASANRIWADLVAASAKSIPKQLKITSTSFTTDQIQALESLGFDLQIEHDSPENPAPGMLLYSSKTQTTHDSGLFGLPPFDASSWDIRIIASDAF